MAKKPSLKPLAAAVGTAFAVSMAAAPVANAASNPFSMSDLSSGYELVAEGKCGEGKCGAGKSATSKDPEGRCGAKTTEGKCGEGKCGGTKSSSEGKCGEGKCGGSKSSSEGKCGEAKCGANK